MLNVYYMRRVTFAESTFFTENLFGKQAVTDHETVKPVVWNGQVCCFIYTPQLYI